MPQITTDQREKAYAILKEDAEQILRLIEVQIDNLMAPKCPLYEEVLDTQMFGLSREIDFAKRLGLITEEQGKKLLDNLEHKLSILHETVQNTVKDV
ncbi:MAG: YlaN family protein [Bacilli bacterium]|nr:YlaN family protein [Bacilli bacterium]